MDVIKFICTKSNSTATECPVKLSRRRMIERQIRRLVTTVPESLTHLGQLGLGLSESPVILVSSSVCQNVTLLFPFNEKFRWSVQVSCCSHSPDFSTQPVPGLSSSSSSLFIFLSLRFSLFAYASHSLDSSLSYSEKPVSQFKCYRYLSQCYLCMSLHPFSASMMRLY